MRVLVTGGAGYVGSVTVEALVEAGHVTVVLDDCSTGHAAAVVAGARLVRADYTNEATTTALLRDERIEAVVHCAARSLVGESIRDPARYYRQNVAGGVALLEACRTAGVQRFVFSSTAAVYGTPEATPIDEDAPLRPINPYGETKRTFEAALTWYGQAYGLRSVILRYFNVAGATAANGEDHDPETHLIPNILRAAEGRGALTLFGDDYPTRDGTCVRDFVHVEDLADAHVLALEHLERGGASAAVNLGTGVGSTVQEVLDTARAASGVDIPSDVVGRRPGDPVELVADNHLAAALLGWTPTRSLHEIVASAWAWHAAHPDGYGAR